MIYKGMFIGRKFSIFCIDPNQIFVYINHKGSIVSLNFLHAFNASEIFINKLNIRNIALGQNGPFRYGTRWNRVPFCPYYSLPQLPMGMFHFAPIEIAFVLSLTSRSGISISFHERKSTFEGNMAK